MNKPLSGCQCSLWRGTSTFARRHPASGRQTIAFWHRSTQYSGVACMNSVSRSTA